MVSQATDYFELKKNAFHTDPFTAIAELVDNSYDANKFQLIISNFLKILPPSRIHFMQFRNLSTIRTTQ